MPSRLASPAGLPSAARREPPRRSPPDGVPGHGQRSGQTRTLQAHGRANAHPRPPRQRVHRAGPGPGVGPHRLLPGAAEGGGARAVPEARPHPAARPGGARVPRGHPHAARAQPRRLPPFAAADRQPRAPLAAHRGVRRGGEGLPVRGAAPRHRPLPLRALAEGPRRRGARAPGLARHPRRAGADHPLGAPRRAGGGGGDHRPPHRLPRRGGRPVLLEAPLGRARSRQARLPQPRRVLLRGALRDPGRRLRPRRGVAAPGSRHRHQPQGSDGDREHPVLQVPHVQDRLLAQDRAHRHGDDQEGARDRPAGRCDPARGPVRPRRRAVLRAVHPRAVAGLPPHRGRAPARAAPPGAAPALPRRFRRTPRARGRGGAHRPRGPHRRGGRRGARPAGPGRERRRRRTRAHLVRGGHPRGGRSPRPRGRGDPRGVRRPVADLPGALRCITLSVAREEDLAAAVDSLDLARLLPSP